MYLCPICQKSDQLMKVTFLVQQGTGQADPLRHPSTHGSHGESSLASGIQRSELAKKLALPPTPTQPSVTIANCLTWALIFLIIPLVILGLGIACATGMGNFYQQALTFSQVLAFSTPVFLFIVLLISFRAGRTRYSVEKPKWDRARHIWDRLYYCFRDNKVYDPETGEAFDVLALNKHIFQTE